MIPYIDVQNVSKAFGAHVLFENISFSVAEGQHVGLIAKKRHWQIDTTLHTIR